MKASELAGMSGPELRNKAVELREELARLNLRRYARRLDKTAQLGKVKRDIARVLTVLRGKESVTTTEESDG